jgi:hypothetical protein
VLNQLSQTYVSASQSAMQQPQSQTCRHGSYRYVKQTYLTHSLNASYPKTGYRSDLENVHINLK